MYVSLSLRLTLLGSPLTKVKRFRNRARHIAKSIVYVYTRMHIYMQTQANPASLDRVKGSPESPHAPLSSRQNKTVPEP